MVAGGERPGGGCGRVGEVRGLAVAGGGRLGWIDRECSSQDDLAEDDQQWAAAQTTLALSVPRC